MGFEKIPVKSKKAQDKFKNPTSSRPGSVPVKKVPSGGVPVRGGSQQPPVRRVAPVSPGVGVRPVQQAGRGVPVRQGYARSQVPVRRVASPGSVPVRQGYVRSQASVGRVYSGGVAVRSVPQQSQVRRVAPVSPGGVVVRRAPAVKSRAPLSNVRPGNVPVGRRPQQSPVRRVVPVSPGVGVRPVQQVRRVAPVSPGGVAVRRAPAVKSRAPLSNVLPGNVPVGRRPQQSPVRRVVPVSPGVGVRPVQQVRRAVPVRRVPVTSSLSPPAGRAVQDNGLGIIPPVKKVSGSKLSVFKNAFGGVRDRFEDVLDKFDGVGDVFDSFKERFEGVQSVMGFLIVHWWAILVVLGVIGILTFSGFVGISSLKQECTFSLSVDCLDHSVKKDSIEFLIKNVAERNIIVKNIKVRSDALEGFSGSDSGICELSLDQRGRDLKKNQKYLFQLNVRPAVSLSAAAPNDDNGFDLLAESVTLARAQGYNDPYLTATLASVSCAANGSASDYLGRFNRNDPLRVSLDHHMGLVTDAIAKDPTPDSVSPASRASTRATTKASEIKTVIYNLVSDINNEASRRITAGSSNPYQNVRNALRNAPDNFDSDSLQHKYALMVRYSSQAQQTGDRIVQSSRSDADKLIAEVTATLNNIPAAAREESNRAFNPESIKQVAREVAERYAGRDSYFAADFVAKEVEKAGTIQQIRSRVNDAYNTHFSGTNRGGSLSKYQGTIFHYSKLNGRAPYYQSSRGPSSSYSDYFEKFNVSDFKDVYYPTPSLGPVVNHYHALVRDRVIPPYTRELEDLENSAFYRGLSSSEKAALSRAFNDPYYDGQPTTPYYGLPITSPLDDPELSTRNNSKHRQANDILKDELYDRFNSIVPGIVAGAVNAAGQVYRETIRQLDDPVDAESVKDVAKKEADRYKFGDRGPGPAIKFVIQRIERITSSDKDVVVSEIEAAVSDAIEAVTEGANYAADQARDANSGSSSGPFESQIKSYIRSKYPSSHAGYHAAIFIANSDISGTDGTSVAGKVTSAGDKIINAVKLAVGNVSGDARYWSSGCSSGCSRYCYDANCQFEEYVLEFPNRCDGQCTDVGGSCSDDSECCSGSCESGACLDPNAAVCGLLGLTCCSSGRACVSGFVCGTSGVCEVPVVCGSVGQACCTSGAACVSGFVCGTSGVCEVPVVCGSVGQVCCTSGDECRESGLECRSGTCQAVEGCGSQGQECCTGDSECGTGLACVTSGDDRTCQSCGQNEQACCAGDTCGSDLECRSGTCQVSCGAEGQQCCTDGSQCTGDLVCADSGTGSTCQQCGSGSQVCCSNRTCNENFECTGQGIGTCVGDCGSEGQECCSGDSECGTGLACVTSGDDRTCQSCGQNEQACCTTGDECRESGFECSEGTCVEAVECGSEGKVCCSRNRCDSGLECESGTCREVECGSEGQVCCSRNRCDSGLECESGTCREIACGYEGQDCCSVSTCASGLECRLGSCKGVKCGSEGSVCCRGGKCDSDLGCVDNLCEMPEVQIEFVQHFSLGTLIPGLNESLTVTEPGILFSSIKFAVSVEVRDAELNVTSRSELPAGISGGPAGMQSYGYVTIASEDIGNEGVSGVYVEFSVDKDFFSDVSPSQIRFFEYNQETQAWNKLDDPVHLSEDAENHYFSVVTGGLTGDFAIALENFVSCAHRNSAEGRSRYRIELTYSWEDSPTLNHKVVGELSADTPE